MSFPGTYTPNALSHTKGANSMKFMTILELASLAIGLVLCIAGLYIVSLYFLLICQALRSGALEERVGKLENKPQ